MAEKLDIRLEFEFLYCPFCDVYNIYCNASAASAHFILTAKDVFVQKFSNSIFGF